MIKSVGHVVVSFILCFLFHMFVALSFYAPPPRTNHPMGPKTIPSLVLKTTLNCK